MKKKIISIIVSLLVVAISFLMMGASDEGCGFEGPTEYKTKYFIFRKNSGSTKVVVLKSLTEEGLKQEVLIVPAFVSGYPVTSFGRRLDTGASPIKSDILKKLYLPYTLGAVPFGITDYEFPNIISLIVNYSDKFNVRTGIETKQTVRSKEYFMLDYEEPYSVSINGYEYNLIECNFTCYFNYEDSPNNNVFWIDFIEEGSIYVKPSYNPIREGFYFRGWYLEETCETPWDNVMPKYPEQLNLFAKWQAKEEV